MIYIKVLLIEKAWNIVLQSSKHEETIFLMGLSLCLSHISLQQYYLKNVVKVGSWEKIYKEGDGHIGGLSTEGGFKSSTNYE